MTVGLALLRQADVQVHTISLSEAATPGPADVAAKIAIELRNQYALAYSPKNSALDGSLRAVKVELIQPRGVGAEYYARR